MSRPRWQIEMESALRQCVNEHGAPNKFHHTEVAGESSPRRGFQTVRRWGRRIRMKNVKLDGLLPALFASYDNGWFEVAHEPIEPRPALEGAAR